KAARRIDGSDENESPSIRASRGRCRDRSNRAVRTSADRHDAEERQTDPHRLEQRSQVQKRRRNCVEKAFSMMTGGADVLDARADALLPRLRVIRESASRSSAAAGSTS